MKFRTILFRLACLLLCYFEVSGLLTQELQLLSTHPDYIVWQNPVANHQYDNKYPLRMTLGYSSLLPISERQTTRRYFAGGQYRIKLPNYDQTQFFVPTQFLVSGNQFDDLKFVSLQLGGGLIMSLSSPRDPLRHYVGIGLILGYQSWNLDGENLRPWDLGDPYLFDLQQSGDDAFSYGISVYGRYTPTPYIQLHGGVAYPRNIIGCGRSCITLVSGNGNESYFNSGKTFNQRIYRAFLGVTAKWPNDFEQRLELYRYNDGILPRTGIYLQASLGAQPGSDVHRILLETSLEFQGAGGYSGVGYKRDDDERVFVFRLLYYYPVNKNSRTLAEIPFLIDYYRPRITFK